MKENLKNIFFKIWYWYVSIVDKQAEVTFMNYGYSNGNQRIALNNYDEKDRYSAQLYDYVATGAEIKGKEILEVGCGRGGGLSYINRYLLPGAATGLDLNHTAIEFCQKFYISEGIKFLQGNAQSLTFKDDSFDVVFNVESSHRYPQMEKFVKEVYRVLKPGGIFLFADFRLNHELDNLATQFSQPGFTQVKNEVITPHVLEALQLSGNARLKLIYKLVPKLLRGIGKQFAALEGTPTYNKFATQQFEYVYYVLRK